MTFAEAERASRSSVPEQHRLPRFLHVPNSTRGRRPPPPPISIFPPFVRPSVLFHFGTGPVQKVGNAAADQWAYDGGGDGREGREGIPRGSELAMAGIASSFGKPSARCCIRREILADQVITTSSSYHNLRGVEGATYFLPRAAFRLITGSQFVSRLRRDPR